MRQKIILSAALLTTASLVGCQPRATHQVSQVNQQATQKKQSIQQSGQSPVKQSSKINQSDKTTSSKTTLGYQVETYRSEALGSDRTYGVVLPPGYEQHPEKRYPVIFLLHGGHGDPTAWFEKGNALSVIEQVYGRDRLPPSIIITPDGNDLRGSSALWDPEYIDGANGKVLSAIGIELVQVIKSRYRTKETPEFWAIGGMSSGGWGALNIGLHSLQNFRILFSHSGYFKDASGAENSPLLYVQNLSPEERRNAHIYLDAGAGDGKYLAESQEFHQVLEQLQISNQFNEFPGGHGVGGENVGWHYWHRHLADSLSYVGDRFREVERSQK